MDWPAIAHVAIFPAGILPSCLASHQARDVEAMLIQCWIIDCDAGRA